LCIVGEDAVRITSVLKPLTDPLCGA